MGAPKRNVEKPSRVLAPSLRSGSAGRSVRVFSVRFLGSPHAFPVPSGKWFLTTFERKRPMSNKLASLTKNEKGIFTGTLATMAVRTRITIVPNAKAHGEQPDYRVFANGDYEIGAAWSKTSETTNNEYLSVKLAAPELGGMAIYANVIALDEIGEDNVTHLMLWSAREPQAASSQMAA
jgi:uncharacterized protein (DUF736 family)